VRYLYLEIGSKRYVSKTQLVNLKRRAIRAGVWFRRLPRIDRALVDLTIKVARNIRSITLAISVASVAKKLEDLFEGKLTRTIRDIGFSLAFRLSLIAQNWGNKSARAWAGDANFARYLAVMKLHG
jgi:hypothetical protein